LTENELLTSEHILVRLAEQLDDDTLKSIFPGQHPAGIRRMMTGIRPKKKCAQEHLVAPSPSLAVFASPLLASSSVAISATGPCRLFTDGASRGNPGQAGAGAVLLTENDEELATCSVYLGTCTNNVAEYKALIIGLDEALRCGCTELAIALDSELIVRQIQGRYKVKNEALLLLFQQVRARLDRFNRWTIHHVLREQNARADTLANQGIDERKN
jgi:ribonuclease HI